MSTPLATVLACLLGCWIALLVQHQVPFSLGPFALVWGLLLVPTFLAWTAFTSALPHRRPTAARATVPLPTPLPSTASPPRRAVSAVAIAQRLSTPGSMFSQQVRLSLWLIRG